MSSVVALTELLTINTGGSPVSPSNPLPVSVDGFTIEAPEGLPVVPENITGKFRETFENFTPGVNWNLTTGSGDIVQTDGNAVSASYLVISKDPLTPNTETILTYTGSFSMPIELAVGLSMSQRVLGQELAMELVSTEDPLPSLPDVAISSIQQTTTTLTVTTSSNHGLVPGMRIGIRGITSDSRFNYPALVIASTPSLTQFTCNASPAGTIASVTAGPYTNQGFVYVRSAMGGARNGMSEIFENATTTNASMYFRSASGDALPSGTFGGNHSVTVANTASTAGISSPYTYAFLPTSEYRFSLQADRGMVYDVGIDSSGSQSVRLMRTQVVPDPTKQYTLRFRMTNNAALTVPTAKIISAVKSGSTVATITTDGPHGLTTGDYVVVYGNRDQTNFANLTTAGTISVINATTFQLGYGASATATTYGGMVMRVNGGNVPTAVTTVAVQTAAVANGELTLVGSANWGGAVGNYVNVYGVRNNTNGADMGVDGVYKVASISTTTMVLLPIGGTVLPAPFTTTNCGGTVLTRTDARISFVRIFEYVRQRVEMLAQPTGAVAAPVFLTGGTVSTVSGGTIGTQAFPNQLANDIASAALTSSNTSSTIAPANNSCSLEYNVIVTAVSGTNPTMDVVVQESDDTGTNWYDVYHFPRITTTGQFRSPLIPQTGNRVRYVRTLGGTSPSFTNAVNRVQSNSPQPVQRQFFTRIDMNTLNTVTASFFTEGCVDLNVVVAMGAITTTAPVLAFEVSADNSIWTQVGSDITTVANTAVLVQLSNVQARFSRLRTKTAGSGASTNFMMVKGVGK